MSDGIVLCAECNRELEECGFCGEHCGHEICYRCSLVMLKETLPQPHIHGG